MRNRSVDGGGIQIEAAALEDGRIAVTLRAATTAAGPDTEPVARVLHISTYTVQDHLTSVFAKLAAHPRAEVTERLLGAKPLQGANCM